MNLFETFKDLIQVNQIDQSNRPAQRAAFLRGQPIPAAMKATDYLKAYKGWVYACVSVTAEAVGDIKLILKRRTSQMDSEIVDDHPVLDLLYNVNPLATSYDLFESTQGFLSLAGESFWWLVGDPRDPAEIWPLRPDWMKVKDTKNKMIQSYLYGPPGEKKVEIPFEEIIPLKDFHPLNPFRGYGTVQASDVAIDTDNYAKQFNARFFVNSARPGGALQTEQELRDEQYTRIREEWERAHRGVDKAWQVAILEAGLQWSDIGLSQKEMDFVEGRRFNRDEIFAMFRVPKPLVAISDDVNRAAAKEARAVFLENTIEPKLRRITTRLTEFLLPRYGDAKLFFDFESPVPDDQDVKLKEYDNALRHGWMTRNEIREGEGLEPIEGGDKLLIPFSLQEIGQSTDETKNSQKQRNINNLNVRLKPLPVLDRVVNRLMPLIQQKAEALVRARHRAKAVEAEIVNGGSEKKESKKKENRSKKAKVIESEAERKAQWLTVIKRTEPRENEYRRALNEEFTKQEARVKQKLDLYIFQSADVDRKDTKKVDLSIEDVVDFTGENDIFAAPLMNVIRNFIYAEGVLQLQDIDPNKVFYMASAAVKKYLTVEGARMISFINDETRDQIRETLVDGVNAGESISKLQDRVGAVYEDARGFRSERIARTEVGRAQTFATIESYRQSGVVEKKEWLATRDSRVREDHAHADGQQVPLDKPFKVGGESLMYPVDPNGSASQTVNCRCTMIPVIEEA